MEVDPDALTELGRHLVWRIGKSEDEEVLVVRVGLASATPRFAQLPRLRNVSEAEIEALVKAGKVKVEWVE
ncbi:DUF3248 domain-containing protein [Marinithermus hydrothermalis]|uniref:DUF3248 domain-containing protein n=1 Tax=Marinithermus hydrothermalis (strain DSM 14884 / JCM 11576 / T1) TaxID=869210 RepID=F2NK94_MARHT|nr:hypothetical protein Marky_1608 [Marinithermus hydrothermalis DSM 14884]